MSLNRRSKAFIFNYTNISNRTTYLNGYQSCVASGYSPKCSYSHSTKLLNTPEIKQEIDKILEDRKKALYISKEDYLSMLQRELENCKNPSSRIRLIELIGRVHDFIDTSKVVVQNAIMDNYSDRAHKILYDTQPEIIEHEKPITQVIENKQDTEQAKLTESAL